MLYRQQREQSLWLYHYKRLIYNEGKTTHICRSGKLSPLLFTSTMCMIYCRRTPSRNKVRIADVARCILYSVDLQKVCILRIWHIIEALECTHVKNYRNTIRSTEVLPQWHCKVGGLAFLWHKCAPLNWVQITQAYETSKWLKTLECPR